MKNLLFLIVVGSLYLHFYPNEAVTKFYDETKQIVLTSLGKFTDTKVRLKSDKIYHDLEGQLGRFSDKEVEHLKEITSSRDNVKVFYQKICKTEKRDIVFRLTNEKKVCATINRYTNLL